MTSRCPPDQWHDENVNRCRSCYIYCHGNDLQSLQACKRHCPDYQWPPSTSRLTAAVDMVTPTSDASESTSGSSDRYEHILIGTMVTMVSLIFLASLVWIIRRRRRSRSDARESEADSVADQKEQHALVDIVDAGADDDEEWEEEWEGEQDEVVEEIPGSVVSTQQDQVVGQVAAAADGEPPPGEVRGDIRGDGRGRRDRRTSRTQGEEGSDDVTAPIRSPARDVEQGFQHILTTGPGRTPSIDSDQNTDLIRNANIRARANPGPPSDRVPTAVGGSAVAPHVDSMTEATSVTRLPGAGTCSHNNAASEPQSHSNNPDDPDTCPSQARPGIRPPPGTSPASCAMVTEGASARVPDRPLVCDSLLSGLSFPEPSVLQPSLAPSHSQTVVLQRLPIPVQPPSLPSPRLQVSINCESAQFQL